MPNWSLHNRQKNGWLCNLLERTKSDSTLDSKKTHRKRLLTRKTYVEIEKLSSGNMTNLTHRLKQYHKKRISITIKSSQIVPTQVKQKGAAEIDYFTKSLYPQLIQAGDLNFAKTC